MVLRSLDRARLYVDFNEMVDEARVLLSRDDSKLDSAGNVVEMREGERVYVYMDDADDDGQPAFLVATGIVERNHADDWSKHARWCCRIDAWE